MKKVLFGASIAMLLASAAQAQVLSEDFVGNQGGTSGNPCVTSSGVWTRVRNSVPAGTLQSWFLPGTTVFNAQDGSTQQYCAANYNDVAGANTISSWYISPQIPLVVGGQISFYTRTIDLPSFPDRMQLRISGNGASTNVGATPTSVGDFTRLALDINPTYTTTGYPSAWTQFTYNIQAGDIGTGSGRIAFRYFVEGGGPSGANSDYIGIDTIRVTPEPTTLALLVMGGLALIRRKR